MIYVLALILFVPICLAMIIASVKILYSSKPMDLLNTIDTLPDHHYLAAIKSISEAQSLANKAIFFDVTAPIVVPFILLFTKWGDEKLAFWDNYYGNNVSINGDRFVWVNDPVTNKQVPLPISIEDDAETRALAYWVGGQYHPRSFIARYVWLGLRNRASKFSQLQGIDITDFDNDREYWGDPNTSRSHEGTVLFRCGPVYQLHHVQKISSTRCIRVNCGYKIWRSADYYSKLVSPVDIRMSWTKWTGNT